MRATQSSVLLCALLLAGCSTTSGTTGTGTQPQPTTSATPPAGASSSQSAEAASPLDAIPNGTYSTEVLRADEVKRGFPASRVNELIRPEGMKVVLKFRDSHWLVFVSDPASGALVQGDGGTTRYSKRGIAILENDSRFVVTVRWSLDGGYLNLVFVSLTGDPANDIDSVRIVLEHRFLKVA